MNRQYAKIVTCVSLSAYGVIVLAGQAAHLIPGVGCHCHSGWQASQKVAAINRAFAASVDSLVGRGSGAEQRQSDRVAQANRVGSVAAIHSNDDCPICHWFSLAQQPVEPIDDVIAIQAACLSIPSVQHIYSRSLSSALARGPPLRTS